MYLTLKLLIFSIAIINQSFGLPTNATKNNNNINLININNTKSENISRLLSFTIGNCLVKSNISRCFKKYFIQILDECVKDNNTWEFGDFITIEKNMKWSNNNNISVINNTKLKSDDELNNEFKIKMNQLIESRSIRFSPVNAGKSEGRKKKDKGGMALIGGMAMAGMMAQMFMGKMLMIAGAAFIMAKLALFFSVLNSLKKGGGGGHSEHVIYTDGGGGGGGGHGWNRQYANAFPEELAHAQNRQVFI